MYSVVLLFIQEHTEIYKTKCFRQINKYFYELFVNIEVTINIVQIHVDEIRVF